MKKLVMGILAHVDAGKTTLSEALLYESGVIRRLGRVDHKDAFLDTDAMERERGITIFSKQAVLPLGDMEVTLLDTPGHVDFSAETERTLRVLTAAAGTELADPYSYDTFSHLHVGEFTLVQKQFTTHRAVFLHAAWLVQTCVH